MDGDLLWLGGTWLGAVPVFLVALLWSTVPGAMWLRSLGFTPRTALAYSPAASFSLLGLLSLASGWGLAWRPWTVLAAVAAVCAASALATRLLTPRTVPPGDGSEVPRGTRIPWAPLAGWALGAAAIGVVLARGMIRPGWPNQAWDAGFHYSGTQLVVDTADASPFHLLRMIGHGQVFYPDLIHAHASLVAQTAGQATVLSVNMSLMVWAAVLVPWGMVLAAHRLLRSWDQPWAVCLGAGAMAAALPVFPLMFVYRGAFLANVLGTALMPFLVLPLWKLLALWLARPAGGTTASAATPATKSRPTLASRLGRLQENGGAWILLALLAAPGVALAHPSSLFTAALLTLPGALWFGARWVRGASSTVRRGLRALGVAVVLAVFAVVWVKVSPGFSWTPRTGLAGGLQEVATLSLDAQGIGWVAPALLWVGAAVGVKSLVDAARGKPGSPPHLAFAAGGFLLAGFLYWTAVSWPVNPFTEALTGMWYNNARRVASALALPVVLLVAGGAGALAGLVSGRLRPAGRGGKRLVGITAALVVPLALAPAVATAAALSLEPLRKVHVIQQGAGNLEPENLDNNVALLTTDKVAALRYLATLGESGRILADPFAGGAYIFSVSGRPVGFPMTSTKSDLPDPDGTLRELGADPASPQVCRTLRELGFTHIAQLGVDSENYLDPAARQERVWAGLRTPLAVPWAREVWRQGQAVVFSIGDCGP